MKKIQKALMIIISILIVNNLSIAMELQTFLINEEYPTYDPVKYIQNDKGGKTIVGKLDRKGVSNMFIANFVPSETNNDSLILDWYRDFIIDDTTDIFIDKESIVYSKENGNIVIILPHPVSTMRSEGIFFYMIPYIIEYDKKGNLISSHWDNDVGKITANIEGYYLNYEYDNTYGHCFPPILLHSDYSFSIINNLLLGYSEVKRPDSLPSAQMLVRHFNSLGNFQRVYGINNVDISPREFEDVISTKMYYGPMSVASTENAIFLTARRNETTMTNKTYNTDCVLKLNSNYDAEIQYFVPTIYIQNQRFAATISRILINNKGNLVVFFSYSDLTKTMCEKWASLGVEYFNEGILVLDTNDLSIITEYRYINTNTSEITPLSFKQLNNGKYLLVGYIHRGGAGHFSIRKKDYYAELFNEDFSMVKTIRNISSNIDSNINRYDNYFSFADELPDGRLEFWGMWSYYTDPYSNINKIGEDQVFRLVVNEDDFVENTNIVIKTNIEDLFLPIELNSVAYPNPASKVLNIDVAVEISRVSSIKIADNTGKIVLNSAIGTLEISKELNISSLPTGDYFITLTIDNTEYSKHFIIAR